MCKKKQKHYWTTLTPKLSMSGVVCVFYVMTLRPWFRHLRLKHEEQVRLARGVDAEFRCEQCGESFGTQDDLYYHSAIHATQNLICPLCQEKFENVDAVTTHIRTHVNGQYLLHIFLLYKLY